MTGASLDELRAALEPAATIGSDGLSVTDPAAFRGPLTDELVRDAVFHADPAIRDARRWVIWAASQALGQLEAHLDVRLFHRTTRSLSLTEEGRAFLEAAQPGLATVH